MELKKINYITPETTPPAPEGWVRYWHGYHQMTKVRSAEKIKKNIEQHRAGDEGILSERKVEIQVFLNILGDIRTPAVTMFELGAGRGDWCLSLAGVVDFRLIPLSIRDYRCLALEGEPSHYQWTRDHFSIQNIKGTAVHGAVSSTDGVVRFKAIKAPEDSYGQGVDREKGNIEVPAYTIDTLMRDHGFDHLDLIHMDVQGEEYNALMGAENALTRGAIDYFLIGTHYGPKMNEQIVERLSPMYEVIFNVAAGVGTVDTVFGRAHFPKDGILALKKK